MTVWNEFFGGFQQNMRNDYVKQNLKENEREITMHCQEYALPQTTVPYAGVGGRK